MNIGSDQLDQALFALNDQLTLRRGSVHLIVIGGRWLDCHRRRFQSDS
jgi:hypothetical protein